MKIMNTNISLNDITEEWGQSKKPLNEWLADRVNGFCRFAMADKDLMNAILEVEDVEIDKSINTDTPD